MPGVIVDTVVDSAALTDLDDWNEMPEGIPQYMISLSGAESRSRQVFEHIQPQFAISTQQYARTLIANHDCRRKREYEPQERLAEDYELAFKNIRDFSPKGNNAPSPRSGYMSSLREVFAGRSFFATEKGRIGVGPCEMRPGDLVVVIFSGYCPLLLRRQPRADTYHILGDAYVEGLMKGEVFECFDISKNGYEKFRIV
jgi:hypothetical protein